MNDAQQLLQHFTPLIGQALGVSRWFTVDQARINQFATTTEDEQWIHIDSARAQAESPFGTTIGHGYLSLSLLAPSSFDAFMHQVKAKQVINYGLDKVRFIAPVHSGKRIRNHVKLVSVEDKGGGRILLSTENTMEIEGHDKPALIATTLFLIMV